MDLPLREIKKTTPEKLLEPGSVEERLAELEKLVEALSAYVQAQRIQLDYHYQALKIELDYHSRRKYSHGRPWWRFWE